MSNELSFYRGDTAQITCSVVNGTGGTYNLSGNTTTFTVKETEDGAAFITKTADTGSGITLGTGGVMTIDIGSGETSSMSGRYIYDIQVAKSGNVYTVVKDKFTITKDVTA